ncbi:transglutaminase-like domain-containing protein [Flavobacterium psychrotolerans]|uniref:Transglutaminase family protein n=1 Tax=Flavobacterium psychrotolerans TaxID=2169410 RepID=A0A2U1JL28_9FLAO|nr:transglutaminase family protein [Flavobacterium psychrotolerans]PWA05852.1 transglutaminase family protein [Flavobacterium psychrotolerans]
MKFKVFGQLSYEVFSETTFIFNIQAAKSASQTIIQESLTIIPEIKFEEFLLKNNSTRFLKLVAKAETSFTITYQAEVAVIQKIRNKETLRQSTPIIDLDPEVLPFISPSRYCESDKLSDFSNDKFGHLTNNYDKVLAINNWIFSTIQYKIGSTDSSISAYDILNLKHGVCKDFSHLGIALCRSLDIPARYFTGYAYNLNPPDFHACFEAYISGNWILFDPTQLSTNNLLVKIAEGKDASEVAVASYFGNTICTNMNIQCAIIDSHLNE